MECNRDEAIRAKTIAEEKFNSNDFVSAKIFAQKAQNLHPELDGISQMLRPLDVYIFSEMKVGGEPDWYAILDVKPSDDDKTIKNQYRKLVFLIHPDKNRSVGAGSGFDIISNAWDVLSDKTKRSTYDQKRNSGGFQQKDLPERGNSSTESPGVNEDNYMSANRETSKPESYGSTSTCQTGPAPVPTQTQSPPPTPAPAIYGGDIFWTICYRCKKEYDFFKMFLSQILICPNCHISLLPTEMPAPMNLTQPAAPATVWAPFGPAPHAQVQMPLNFIQPAPLPTLWAPFSPYSYGQIPWPFNMIPQMVPWGGLGPNTQMPVPQNFTLPTTQSNGLAPSGRPGSWAASLRNSAKSRDSPT